MIRQCIGVAVQLRQYIRVAVQLRQYIRFAVQLRQCIRVAVQLRQCIDVAVQLPSLRCLCAQFVLEDSCKEITKNMNKRGGGIININLLNKTNSIKDYFQIAFICIRSQLEINY